MSFKLTAILMVVLALLAGSAYALERTRPKATAKPATYLYKYAYEDIVRIDLTAGDKSLCVRQKTVGDSSAWVFCGEGDAADTVNASNIQLIMSGPAYERVVADGELAAERLPQYGLARPSITATITLKDGRTHRALLGDKTPDGKYHYAKNADSATIYLVDKVWGDELVRVVNNPPVPTATPTPS